MTNQLINDFHYLRFIVPDAAAALVRKFRVETVSTPGGAVRMVPYLLLDGGHQGYGETHPLCSSHPSDSMNVILLLVGQRDVDDVGKSGNVESSCRDIRADQEPHVSSLEPLQVLLPLVRFPVAMETHARIGVVLVLSSARLVEVTFHVVAIDFRSAEDNGFVHL